MLAILTGVALAWDSLSARWWLVGAAAVLVLVYAAIVPRWRYLVHRWEVSDSAVYTQTGGGRASAGSRRCRGSRPSTTPRARSRGLFGLATVTVTTASAAGALRIEGLDRALAQRLVDDLTLKADAVEGDAHVSRGARPSWSSGRPEWQRLDQRMLLVHPVREVVRFLPVLIGLFVAGSASGGDGPWQYLGVLVPITLGVLRYLTTRFRIAQGRVELRRGLLNRHVLSTPLDRVRTVDVTASLIHRAPRSRHGADRHRHRVHDSDERLDLDGLPADRAREPACRAAARRAGRTGDAGRGRRCRPAPTNGWCCGSTPAGRGTRR